PLYPDIAQLEAPVVPLESKPEARRLALNEDKICVFLGDDRLCRIHKHMGSAAKPLICRTFPVQIVETESELRVGVSRCFEAHHSYNDGSPEQSPSEITGLSDSEPMALDKRGLNPADRLNLMPPIITGTLSARNAALEKQWLSLLQHPEVTVELLMHTLLEAATRRPLPKPHAGLLSSPGGAKVVSNALGTWASSLYTHSKEQFERSADWTLHAATRSLLLCLMGIENRPFTGLTPGERDYGFHVLREWFFVRNWYNQGTFEHSSLVMVLGLIAAHWHAEDAGVEDPNLPGDAFAYPLTAWTRITGHPDTLGVLLANGRYEALVAALVEANAELASAQGSGVH
ncbi:MAG: hypothetical protein AAFS10_17700, partial [Myxococcota bacterium]